MLLLPDGLKRVTPVLGPWVPTRLRPELGMIFKFTSTRLSSSQPCYQRLNQIPRRASTESLATRDVALTIGDGDDAPGCLASTAVLRCTAQRLGGVQEPATHLKKEERTCTRRAPTEHFVITNNNYVPGYGRFL